MLQKTEGLVLKTSLFGEADLIVTYLTKDRGILKAFAKSPRKVKSRFGSSLEPLTCSHISFWGKEDSHLPRLVQSDIIYPFDSLRTSLERFLSVSEMFELALHFVPERDANSRVYSLLVHTLRAMEEDQQSGLLMLYYKLRLLEMVGYLPGMNTCGRCTREGNIYYLSSGTVLCRSCAGDHGPATMISPAAARLCATLLEWDVRKLGRIKPADAIIQELTVLLDEHITYLSERTLKTRTFTAP